MLAAGLVAGLLVTGGGASRAGTGIAIRCGPDGVPSGMTVDGRRLDRGSDETVDAFLKRALVKIRQPVQIKGDSDMPYRCIGGAIYSMQMAGISQIEYLSEPGSAAAGQGGEGRHD